MQPLLEVKHLSKSWGERHVVNDLSFHVEASEAFGLLGPNGAGKSTTMMMIAGVLTPDSGEILIRGEKMTAESRELRKHLGVVPQDLAIYPDLSARENLNFFGRLYGLSRDLLHQRVDEGLHRVGLASRADDAAGTFSGGMKRRLNFAAAVLHHPSLLILDEPTVGVDPQSRAHLLDCVRELQSSGTAVIYASHYMEEVETVCSRAAIVDHGTLLACDSIPALLKQIPLEIELRLTQPNVPTDLPAGPGVMIQQGESGSDAILKISTADSGSEAALHSQMTELLRLLAEHHLSVRSIRTLEPNLERLFLKLTGSRLRD
ncbi:MAG: ABC transporter ATP-binding protein [Planctomyces sp.]|jgi:ABC-2 type transport system ATP-binding protein